MSCCAAGPGRPATSGPPYPGMQMSLPVRVWIQTAPNATFACPATHTSAINAHLRHPRTATRAQTPGRTARPTQGSWKTYLSTTYIRAAAEPAAGKVRTHAVTMLRATPHRTADARRVAPAPMIAEVITWVVEMGAW